MAHWSRSQVQWCGWLSVAELTGRMALSQPVWHILVMSRVAPDSCFCSSSSSSTCRAVVTATGDCQGQSSKGRVAHRLVWCSFAWQSWLRRPLKCFGMFQGRELLCGVAATGRHGALWECWWWEVLQGSTGFQERVIKSKEGTVPCIPHACIQSIPGRF